jgi:hypothetical protein
MMVYESIKGLPLNTFNEIIIVVLKKHMVDDVLARLKAQFIEYDNFNIVILNDKTGSSSDTVSQCIKIKGITGEIYIKDVDDYFCVKSVAPNQVCTYSLNDAENITPGNKSYVRINDDNEILTIIEKSVISPYFSCGLYSFDSANDFVDTFKHIEDFVDEEIYISHIIYKMILDGKSFFINEVENFIDWGTQKDWEEFKYQYKVEYRQKNSYIR